VKASDLNLIGPTSFLFKGPFGVGKTIAAATAAIDGPIHLSYWDKKSPIELIRFFKQFRPDLLKNIDYDVYAAENANQYLNKQIDFTSRCEFTAEINDSVTMMTASAVNWSLRFRNQGGKKDKEAQDKTTPLMIPGFDEYKTETSFVTQALDLNRKLKCHVIWTAHPLPKLDMSGGQDDPSGNKMSIRKTNSIVSYGNKVAAIIPGQFTEIYHFSSREKWNSKLGKNIPERLVYTASSGDEYAKTALGLPSDFDVTDKLFWEVWKELVKEANP
jgi:hypothetical protein